MVSNILILIKKWFIKSKAYHSKSSVKVMKIYKDKSDASIIYEQTFSSLQVCIAAAALSCRLCTSLSLEKTHKCLPLC